MTTRRSLRCVFDNLAIVMKFIKFGLDFSKRLQVSAPTL